MEKEIDYKKVGLKCGVEIHQQLDTHKLFCDCPSVLRTDEPDIIVKRRLNAVAGEEGKIDIAAAYEQEKSKTLIYEGYSDSTCQIEFDSEPPKMINPEALETAIQISLLLNAKILPVSQIMRKTVVDGSNTSGFQRTMLIAKDGFVETSFGKIGIQNIGLEEDSARIIKQDKNSATYRLDRLGIPLVEIATSPDIPNAEAAKETALKIGEILRASKVKRGIGTIRQDVNLSISKGARTEIKGVQEPALIAKTIDKEIERQLKEKKKIEPTVRKALENGESEFLRPLPGAARMYPETDLPLVIISREMIENASKNLPKLKEEIKGELKEKGLSDELTKLLLGERMLSEFEALLKLYNNPNFVVKALVLWPKEIASKEGLSEKQKNERISIDVVETLLEMVVKKKLKEEDFKTVMQEIAKGKSIEYSVKAAEKKEEIDLEGEIFKIIKEKPGLNPNAYMGLVMQKFKGKVDARKSMDIIKKYIK